MSTTILSQPGQYTEAEYLEAERVAETRHEFVDGAIYGMAGASEAHNIISADLIGMLYTRVRDKPCRHFGPDMQVRLSPRNRTYYYYPDAMIACDPTDVGNGWRERPSVLFEIISEATRRIDEQEKQLAYLQLESLQAYVRFEQGRPEAVVLRRSEEGWIKERLVGLNATVRISLPGFPLALPLAEIYEHVHFDSAI